ncbi:3-oxoacyl-(acyl-carrier-protein) synthase [Fibrisoma limi BUZ 3]|uniref:3-oxoacyl-(Acyl-carrier-protein) synthase n=2 Tax=Fibrisoma limi TaxID=663275 RepID=I2GN12_9BACT|nr:beta-ketoacyl-ACP synthase III [Fibrisoma limi]CCH55290.1 3-oxoacyl-(acyl-carrier-protein) synthase [Fibrisoma limi BUZ 3]
MMKNAKIAGIGYYVPERVVTNEEIAPWVDVDGPWIEERTGIRERRYAKMGEETATTMGTIAAKIAIDRAGITPNDIDFIIFATMSADYIVPGCGVLLQRELGITGNEIGALDIRNQCSGFIYALAVADKFIKTGTYRNILVVAAERQSFNLDYSLRGRDSAIIFADGAGAVVLQPTDQPNEGILTTHLHADGTDAEELAIINPGSHGNYHLKKYKSQYLESEYNLVHPNTGPFEGQFIYPGVFKGYLVIKKAFQKFPEAIQEAIKTEGYSLSDVDFFVMHQANLRILEYIQKKLGLPDEKLWNNIQQYGNTTAASVPIALCEAWEAGRIRGGDLVCLAAFGSGFTWASALVRW